MEATPHLLTPGFPRILELYQRTFLNFSYIKPEEWSQIQTPNQLMAKQMKVFLENSNAVIEYWNELSSIVNETWTDFANNSRQNIEQSLATVEHGKREFDNLAKSTMKSGEQLRKKAVEMGHKAVDETNHMHNNNTDRFEKKSTHKNATTKAHDKKD